ncbi:glycosyltransferase [Candidatus Stoquefichus massiliensis]|uniref:glycosyltransferase n=1 Tax=Candidatus Stoquefichus massiliensis TaxID=1470350 RepID=UPI000488AA04|nr:glycosyltransferase [Candidatus Stoquefichus massiliensis]
MMIKEKKFISIVFRVRNHEKYIEEFLNQIIPLFEKNFENYELICVNNESTDSTIDKLKAICKSKFSHVTLNIISLAYCKSIEEAIAAGIDFAIGDFVFEFDGIIINYDLESLIKTYAIALQGYDIVLFSPCRKSSISQKMYYALYNIGVIKSQKIYPVTVRVLSRRAINRLNNFAKLYSNDLSNILSCGMDVKREKYIPLSKQIKYDKTEKRERIYKAIESFILYTNTIQIIGLLFSGLSLICGVLFIGDLYACFLCLILFVLFIISVVITQYIRALININIKNEIHLIKNIEKGE